MASPEIAGMVALAQQLAEQELGRRLSFDEIRSLLKSTGDPIIDGDNENDVVPNTGLTFYRVDMLALAEAVLEMKPPASHTVSITAGTTTTGKDFGFAATTSVQALSGDDMVFGTVYGETLRGGAGDDQMQGGAGDDELHGEGGDDSLDGGDGIDQAAYAGNRSNYTVVPTLKGYTVSDIIGSDGSDTLANIEALVFADTTVTMPIGAVSIGGTATQGQPLTASNTLADVDGLGTISYRWQADDTTIGGATGITFIPTEAQVGKVITVTASYTDSNGTAKAVTSAVTETVANVNDSPTGSVTISGTATQHQTLTAANTLGDVDGLGTINYQWKAGGSNISGATGGTLVLTEAEVGMSITLAASYIDGHGTAESVISGATAAVANVNDAPTGAVTIAGTAKQGETLSAGNTLADIDGLGAISYQWKAGGSNISDATGSTFVLTDAQVNRAITVTASYTDGHGSAEIVTSDATDAVANVNDAPTLANTLADRTAIIDTAFSFTIPANTFVDVDAGDTLSYSATKADDTALPAWLAFNSNTRTFNGTPGTSDTGTIDIKVTAKDASDASATDVFALAVSDTCTLSGKTYFWNKVAARDSIAAGHVLMDGVTVSANDGGTAREGTTAAGGAYSVPGVVAATAAVTASQAYSTADKATVTLGDALEVLKLYLGKLASPSPYKYLASDFNADAKVTLTDALGILKSVLNKTGALDPAWVFVDEEANVSTLTKDSAARPTVDAHPVATDPSLNLVAVLRGDANGSWKPAATASYDVLPDDYFTDPTTGLVGLHPDHMSAGQFGIGG